MCGSCVDEGSMLGFLQHKGYLKTMSQLSFICLILLDSTGFRLHKLYIHKRLRTSERC